MCSLALPPPGGWPFDLALVPDPAYLVGGAVRDALLGRPRHPLDLDIVVPGDAVAVARRLANHHGGGFVVLDPKRQIARVVLPEATLDVARQVGPDLKTDLGRRDFRVNALAYDLHQGLLLDPLGGVADLAAGRLCMVSSQNLAADPLRLLRAYRQAAQLQFTLEAETRAALGHLAPHLGRVAPERVQTELITLLLQPQAAPWLNLAWADGVLQPWLPVLRADGLTRLAQLEATDFAQLPAEIATALTKPLRHGRPTWVLVKLACLLPADATVFLPILEKLRFSRAEIQYLHRLGHGQLAMAALETAPLADVLARFQMFQAADSAFPGLAWLSQAAGRCPHLLPILLEHYRNPRDPVAHPNPLVTGQDLIEHLHLQRGPVIGELLADLARAHAQGKIATPAEALALAQHWCPQKAVPPPPAIP
ncbi:MAG: CCA tRNA nucleotidyltransferase [Gloeomargaritaceae cyanobacterium C42_A2020_066]|nr:CCA tRNA nucleotidyltransferase [Gloeomargaritaceae cyanobacterium C42_A2020_066]